MCVCVILQIFFSFHRTLAAKTRYEPPPAMPAITPGHSGRRLIACGFVGNLWSISQCGGGDGERWHATASENVRANDVIRPGNGDDSNSSNSNNARFTTSAAAGERLRRKQNRVPRTRTPRRGGHGRFVGNTATRHGISEPPSIPPLLNKCVFAKVGSRGM